MIDPIIAARNSYLPAARTNSPSEARTEFLTIFYKELLKQAFKAPDLSLKGEEKEDNVISNFNSDIMVEQLARELAKNASTRPRWYSVDEAGR